MVKGGNKRFAKILNLYDLKNEELTVKYTTQASHYYRYELKRSVLPNSEQGELIMRPTYDEGR